MPGRYETDEEWKGEVIRTKISWIICLTPLEELREKSPGYAAIISRGDHPWNQVMLPVPDFGVPDDRDAYLHVAGEVAAELRRGARVLVHCGAGIGRTGTFAAIVLLFLGIPSEQAEKMIKDAGSSTEIASQKEFIGWCRGKLEKTPRV